MELPPDFNTSQNYFLMSYEPDRNDNNNAFDVRNIQNDNVETLQKNHPIGWQFFSHWNIARLQADCGNASYLELEPIMRKVYNSTGANWERSRGPSIPSAIAQLNELVFSEWQSIHQYNKIEQKFFLQRTNDMSENIHQRPEMFIKKNVIRVEPRYESSFIQTDADTIIPLYAGQRGPFF
jgi:hypothetical protein